MSIIEIEVRGTSTQGFEDARRQANETARTTCSTAVDIDEVSRFVAIDADQRRFGVTLKVTCLARKG
jgi:flavin-binding protein dodecin